MRCERAAKAVHRACLKLHAGGHAVTAEAAQVGLAGGEPGVEVIGGDAPA